MKESLPSRTLSLNDFFGSSLRELAIVFHSLAPILEMAGLFVFQVLRVKCNNYWK